MHELDDTALLREYVERDSEEAFATLVTRHVNKVYSVALRHTRNPHSAEEITQAVFVILARKSRHLGRRVILSGWLYQTARLTAVTFIRSEIRRARREQEAHMQTIVNETGSEDWPQIAPLLDAAMAGLNETDRHAVVLRFFDGKSMKEVGTALGANEDAAKKRVNRAVEKLRRFFTKRGVLLPATVLTAAISANSVQAAPVALAKSVTVVALAKGAAASISTLALVKGTMKMMTWIKIKTSIILGAATLVIGGTVAIAFSNTNEKPIVQSKVVSTTKHETTVIGLVNLEDFKVVLLEFRDWFPNRADSMTSREFVREGQSFEDKMVKDAHVKIEIVRIDFANGIIEARENGEDAVYRFKTDEKSNGGLKAANLRLNDLGFAAVFDLYSTISGRTLLVHPVANNKFPVVVAANPQNKAEAIQSLESVLSEKGFAVVPDGNKFEQILPKELAKNANPHSATLAISKAGDNAAGISVNFENVPFNQIRGFYAQLSGREILQEGTIPAVSISLHPINTLTKPELLYALDVLLGWQRVKIINVDEKTSKAITVQPENWLRNSGLAHRVKVKPFYPPPAPCIMSVCEFAKASARRLRHERWSGFPGNIRSRRAAAS